MVTASDIRSLVDEIRSIASKMRTVSAGDYVMSEDINYVVDFCQRYVEALDKVIEWYRSRGIWIPDQVVNLVDAARDKVRNLIRVRSGDIVLPEHHNRLVDALNALYKAVSAIMNYLPFKAVSSDGGSFTESAIVEVVVAKLLFHEPWSYREPPSMKPIFTEHWSYREPPAMTRLLYESWG